VVGPAALAIEKHFFRGVHGLHRMSSTLSQLLGGLVRVTAGGNLAVCYPYLFLRRLPIIEFENGVQNCVLRLAAVGFR
jgi:hypothetical protein